MLIEQMNDGFHHPTKKRRFQIYSQKEFTLSLALIDLGCIKIRFSYLVSNKHGRFDDLSGDKRIRAILG